MDIPNYLDALLEKAETPFIRAVDGLGTKELKWQPDAGSNPIGWLTWHLTRVQDRHVSAMQGKEQAWISDGWHASFDRPPDPEDRGVGHTPEQVADFHPPDSQTLIEHYHAIRKNTAAFLRELTPADLDRPVPAMRGDGTMPLSDRLMATIIDNIQHMGQVCYLVGIIRGAGWYGV